MKSRISDIIKKYRIDIIVTSAIIIISLSALLVLNLTKREGNTVYVEINGNPPIEFPLEKDGEFSLNGGTNILVIKNGEAYLSYSDCPDHTCEKTGKIRYVGETIICLPNKISISIKGESSDGVDLVS